jgi:PIN domain nuclease of toxin-antitoxin system
VRLLLDSHVALWWLADDVQLSAAARAAIAGADQVYVSVVTPWELGIKRASGKIDLPDDLVPQLISAGFEMLPIQAEHAVAAPELPAHHRDPFDRMLIAQAITEHLVLVSADQQLALYPVELLDART